MTATVSRKRIWGWYFFDWASQPYSTLLLTFIFAPYFSEIARGYYLGQGYEADAAAAAAQTYWGLGLTVSSLLIAVLAPFLGALADGSGRRLRWVWLFSACYILGAWMLWTLAPGTETLFWAVFWFGLGLIGMEFATIFTNALLPGLSQEDDVGGISGAGFAFGYLGGVLALAIMLCLIQDGATTGLTLIGLEPLFGLDPEAREGTRAVGPFVALWYAAFMIPFFLWVREPHVAPTPVRIGATLRSLSGLIGSLWHRPSFSAYLASSLFYRDALNALYGFGGVYASGVLGWSITKIGIFGVVGAVTAAIASWIGGRADNRWGPKPVIQFCVISLILVCAVIVGTTREAIFGIALDPESTASDDVFFLCGAVLGAAGGALQAASRTMMVRHTTPARATEAFGLYALSGKVTSFLAPAMISLVTALSGSQRVGMLPLIAMFLIGLVFLYFVNAKGEREW